MIKAGLSDFGQTLGYSATGFRTAEKEAQTRIFPDVSLTSWKKFFQATDGFVRITWKGSNEYEKLR